MSLQDFLAEEAAQSVRRINFDSCKVVSNFPGGYSLVVKGEAPCLNMIVQLAPLIYIECPEYWGIEVLGFLPGGFCLTAMQPFTRTIPLTGITGYRGIEVLGARRSEQIDVPGGCDRGRALA